LAEKAVQRPSDLLPKQKSAKFSSVAKPGPWVTQLSPVEEFRFRDWVAQNKIPFDPKDPASDYDMRGFYKALQAGDPRAARSLAPDGSLHFPDVWKTPYHATFSNESIYAAPGAPHWRGSTLYDLLGDVIKQE
jgi:hypothetical protein